ncbi:MAG: Hypoxanthine-guanine phosphoribosyltransferase [bacterium ADurb.Bin429]|nr:MAG: Hypoxanthine-guanine phosphoribosyltransferase [bacterium ADurb.Bin429]
MTVMYQDDLKTVLYTEVEIAARVAELGARISQDYEGKSIMLVGVLNGAVVFLADLMRAITIPVNVDMVAISSYGSYSSTSGVARIMKDLDNSVESQHVLIVEDIVDTGLTLNYLVDYMRARNPASVKVAAMLSKPSQHRVKVSVDYLGFEVPDEFVVGYGLDFAQRYRNLPCIAVLKPEIYAGPDTPPSL